MVGATLSRWTMSYFAVAFAFLLGAEALMTWGYGFPSVPLTAPETLVLVHVVAIGWLSLLMLGALFQFVPVLVARPIYSNTLPLPTLISLVTGLMALLLGFLQLNGSVSAQLAFFPIAASLLGIGFALALWNLGRTLWRARPLPLPARFVAIGLVCGAVTAALGTVFAVVLGGHVTVPHLLDLTTYGVPIHAIAGLGGWLTFTAMGVSYRLLAMFMLAPEHDAVRSRAVFYGGTAALTVAVGGGVIAICASAGLTPVLIAAGLLGLCTLGLYGGDIVHLYRARKRRAIELNARMAAIALVNLGAAVGLSLATATIGQFEASIGALVFLVTFGWLSGLGLAKLYKIVAFLTWLECYGAVLGKMSTPRVQDLVVEPRAARWFWLYFAGVWSGTASLLTNSAASFRIATALMLVATAGIAFELIQTRLLNNVRVELRQAASLPRPRLFSSLLQQIR